jgi:hypothetical protein
MWEESAVSEGAVPSHKSLVLSVLGRQLQQLVLELGDAVLQLLETHPLHRLGQLPADRQRG